jgi:hypothetical protein
MVYGVDQFKSSRMILNNRAIKINEAVFNLLLKVL